MPNPSTLVHFAFTRDDARDIGRALHRTGHWAGECFRESAAFDDGDDFDHFCAEEPTDCTTAAPSTKPTCAECGSVQFRFLQSDEDLADIRKGGDILICCDCGTDAPDGAVDCTLPV